MIEMEEKTAPVIVNIDGGEITANITPADNICVTLGESAQIDAKAAVNYIKSGEAEIQKSVEQFTQEFDDHVEGKKQEINETADAAETQIDEALNEVKYYAENVKFGMVRKVFAASDWILQNGKYALSYGYDVVSAVYKQNGNNYELMTNIDIKSSEGSVTIFSPEVFAGYALLVNSAEKTEDKHFVFEQGVASDVWDIRHDLDKYPSVTVVDSAGNQFFPAVKYIDKNNCTVSLNGATTGKAYLN